MIAPLGLSSERVSSCKIAIAVFSVGRCTMGLLLLFFDGVGVGRDDPAANPFAAIGALRLAPVAGRTADGAFAPLDATLGVPGLPQSATGQTTLLTGTNAAQVAGHHMTGVPGPSLWPLIEEHSLFRSLVRAGARPTFANAFSREYFGARRPRFSASTRAVLAAGLPFRMWDVEGRDAAALSHDYTGEWMTRMGKPMPRLDAEGAARVLARLVDGFDFVLYEYFLTDIVGHRGSFAQKLEQARRAEALVDAVLRRVDLAVHNVVVTSDHGNLEEGGHARHTLNPVPLLAWGPRAESLVSRAADLTDVAPAVLTAVGARTGVRTLS